MSNELPNPVTSIDMSDADMAKAIYVAYPVLDPQTDDPEDLPALLYMPKAFRERLEALEMDEDAFGLRVLNEIMLPLSAQFQTSFNSQFDVLLMEYEQARDAQHNS